MKKKFAFDYFFLILIFFFGALFFFLFPPVEKRKAVIVSMALFYLLWGAGHSLRVGTFSFKVMAEYFLIALLGGVILWGVMTP